MSDTGQGKAWTALGPVGKSSWLLRQSAKEVSRKHEVQAAVQPQLNPAVKLLLCRGLLLSSTAACQIPCPF